MNKVTLAVAGARKTQSIIDACVEGQSGRRRLVLTFTTSGQRELSARLRVSCGSAEMPDVLGWFAFMLQHCIRPYLPKVYPDQNLAGLNFEGQPAGGRYAKGVNRFFDPAGRAYRVHLSKLAFEVCKASMGSAMDRIAQIYDEIYIDEVQDLTGCDLYILELLMQQKSLDVIMVGDVRQSIFDTNPQDPNLKQYRGVDMINWFGLHERAGLLNVERSETTWRSNAAISEFSDTIFADEYNFGRTESANLITTEHDGIFAVRPEHVREYMEIHNPQPLRERITSAKDFDLEFRNFGVVKGLTYDRVLIFPTEPIRKFLSSGLALSAKSACGLYVAVTRARFSVAFVLPSGGTSTVQDWYPGGTSA